MCGIVFAVSSRPVNQFIQIVHHRQHHRGPDSGGFFFDKQGDCYLGMAHQRLSIVDLSKNGTQPMLSASGRFRIIFNGEIYNYQELHKRYRLPKLRSVTDTEVALELIEKIGVDEACRQFNGMWAMVIHDIQKNRIILTRDRFGKKPMYVYSNTTGIYVASEMHSLLCIPELEFSPDKIVATRFLTQSLQNIDQRSWVTGVVSFPPASIGEINIQNITKGLINLRCFWKPNLLMFDHRINESNLIEELKFLVADSVRLRLMADVPVGVALSGGLDSSIISTISSQFAGVRLDAIKLFSAVNPGCREDESPYVDEVATFLGKEVNRFTLGKSADRELFNLLSICTRFEDGPLSSFSSVLFYKLMESARSAGISVILTGQGADEVFCGYRKYPLLEVKRRLRSGEISSAASLLYGFLINGTLLPQFNIREAKRYSGRSNNSLLGPEALRHIGYEPLSCISSLAARQLDDITKYSVPFLCHYEDRMSMAWSREIRSPFLDYRVVEMGLRMPTNLKLNNGWTKYALRRAFENDLPPSIVWRKDKQGFVNPQDDWLKRQLHDVVLDFMGDVNARVYSDGLVSRENYIKAFKKYCSGNGNIWFRDVFAPFALELWLRTAAGIRNEMRLRE